MDGRFWTDKMRSRFRLECLTEAALMDERTNSQNAAIDGHFWTDKMRLRFRLECLAGAASMDKRISPSPAAAPEPGAARAPESAPESA